MIQDILLQVGLALAYYATLVTVMRITGKRLAGQTTTFDLVILITISVVLQTTALREGVLNALIFIATVFSAHQLSSRGFASILCQIYEPSGTHRNWKVGHFD